MKGMLDIREVARRTGLTSRTLRFYESRGLVTPIRTDSGRRLYGPEALERINHIVALKRAGLTLSQIGEALTKRPLDLARIVGAQLAALAVRQAEIAEAMKLLMSVAARLDRREPLGLDSLCELIRQGETVVESDKWKRELAIRMVGEEKARDGAARIVSTLGSIDPTEYRQKTTELIARIEAAMPLDFDGPEAAALHDEWLQLIDPFMKLTSEAPPTGLNGLPLEEALENIDRWKQKGEAPFSTKAFEFLFAMGRRRKGDRRAA